MEQIINKIKNENYFPTAKGLINDIAELKNLQKQKRREFISCRFDKPHYANTVLVYELNEIKFLMYKLILALNMLKYGFIVGKNGIVENEEYILIDELIMSDLMDKLREE